MLQSNIWTMIRYNLIRSWSRLSTALQAARRLDVEALIDRRRHLVEARDHDDLDEAVLAPLGDGLDLQRVGYGLPGQNLRQDFA